MSETSQAANRALAEDWRYAPLTGYWDEAVLPSGLPRRHWRRLAAAIRHIGFRQFNRHWQSGVQLIRETGIANKLESDPWGNERPLTLDPIPLVIAENDWAHIEKAVIQRATWEK